jgi:uncharacterized protein (TIGR02145 family)
MKRIILGIFAISISLQLYSQSPHGFKYQAVVRDLAGVIMSEKAVSFRISIIQASTSGTVVYRETFSTVTNTYGVVTLEIGSGAPLLGVFENIEWSKDIYYLKIELDATGGSNYILMGVSQLLSVPYALYAEKATYSVTDHDTSAVNELQTLNLNNYKLSISKGNTINLPEGDSSATNEIQRLAFNNDTLLLDRNGGYVYLGHYDNTKAINNLLQKVISDSNFILNYTHNKLLQLSDTVFAEINKEEVNRFAEDSLIRLKEKNDSTYLKNRINDNLIYIQAEQTFRINGDNSNYLKIISDSTYFKGRTDNTNTNLTQETNNRISKDNQLSARIVADSNYMLSRTNTLTTNLNTEISSRISGMNTEINTRRTNDSIISLKERNDSTYLKGLINSNTSNINTQTNYRRYYDSLLGKRITNDSLLKNNSINTEAVIRRQNDSINLNRLIADSSYLKSLINSNTSSINANSSAITTEINNRQNNDAYIINRHVADSIYLSGLINNNSTSITNLNTNLSSNYYTKTDLQGSGGALVHFDNLTNKPTTLLGYGITDATPNSHIGATGTLVHGSASHTASGFMSVADKMKLDSLSGYNTGDQTISTTGILKPKITLSANGGQVVFKGAGHTTLNHYSDTISISSTDTFTTYYAGTGISLSGTTFNTVWTGNNNSIFNNNTGNVGIGTASPNNSAKLDVSSNTQGFLPPRMANSEMLAISSPATGLTVYNNDEQCPCWFNGSMWVCYKMDYKSCGKIDYGNQTYNTVIIGNKCWMKENLNIGTMIQASLNPSNTGTIEKHCYNNVPDSCTNYGGLYGWNEAMNWVPSSNNMPSGVQGICPLGWHIPSNREWDTMEYILYGVNFAGGYMKEKSTKHWLTPNTGADNTSGFSAFGAGNRTSGGGFSNGRTIGYYWTSTDITLTANAIYHSVRYNGTNITASNWDKYNSLSVRCVKD